MHIELRDISVTYPNSVAALHGLNLAIDSGETLVLVGPSGCGKTTTLRLIAGLETPTTGTILLDGRDAASIPCQDRRVAMVFQKPQLLPQRTVRQNLGQAFDLKRSWWRRRSVVEERQVVETARRLEIGHLLDRPTGELSGGEQQRVALGQAWMGPVGARLLDEPFGHLDAPLRWQLRRELHLLQADVPATMVVVTHDPEDALALGGRIAVLDRGELLQVGTAAELRTRPRHRFVAQLLQGSFGQWSFVPAQRTGEGELQSEGVIWKVDPSWFSSVKGPISLGFSPRDVYIDSSGSSFRGEVILLEARDAGRLVTCRTPLGLVSVWLDESDKAHVAPADWLPLNIRFDRVLMFDPVSGKLLSS